MCRTDFETRFIKLNALLLKQQVLDEKIISYAVKNKISDITRLKQDAKISKTIFGLEKHIALLYHLGYRQMPMNMQEMVLNGFRKEDNGNDLTDKNSSPFTTVKPKEKKDEQYWTLSHGAFQEVFEHKDLEPYGHFTLKTSTNKISAIDTASSNEFLIDPVAFAYDFGARMYDARLGIFLSVDPSARKMPGWSPYTAFNNNPIYFADPDGKHGVAVVDKQSCTITIKAVYYVQSIPANNTAVTAFTSDEIEEMQKQANGKLNDANYTVSEGEYAGYNVKFEFEFKEGGQGWELEGEAKDTYQGVPIANTFTRGDIKTRPDLFTPVENKNKGTTSTKGGVTQDNKDILMNKKYDNIRNKIHEIFHTLFFNNDKTEGGKGIGAYDKEDMPNQEDINKLINNEQLQKVEPEEK